MICVYVYVCVYVFERILICYIILDINGYKNKNIDLLNWPYYTNLPYIIPYIFSLSQIQKKQKI